MGCGSSKSDAVVPPQNAPVATSSSPPSSSPPPKPIKPASAPPASSPSSTSLPTEIQPESKNKSTPPPPPPPTSRVEEGKSDPIKSFPPAPASPPPREIVKKFQPTAGLTIITENEATKEKIYLCVMHHPSVETFISIEPRSLELESGATEIAYYVFVIPSDLFGQIVKDSEVKSQICLQILSHTNQLYHTQTNTKSYETKIVQQ